MTNIKKVDLTMLYDDLSYILDILEKYLKENEDKKLRKIYFSLVNVWGENAHV